MITLEVVDLLKSEYQSIAASEVVKSQRSLRRRVSWMKPSTRHPTDRFVNCPIRAESAEPPVLQTGVQRQHDQPRPPAARGTIGHIVRAALPVSASHPPTGDNVRVPRRPLMARIRNRHPQAGLIGRGVAPDARRSRL